MLASMVDVGRDFRMYVQVPWVVDERLLIMYTSHLVWPGTAESTQGSDRTCADTTAV